MVSSARRAGRRSGSCARTSSQSAWAHAPVDCAMSPTTVIEPLSDRRREHPQLHRRQVLRLVDDDVAVGADLVVVGWPGRRRRGLRAEQRARLVEQRDVVDRPRRRRRSTRSAGGTARHCSVVAQALPAAERSSALRAEQVVEQLRRREHRPHPLERLAHLGACGGGDRAPRAASTSSRALDRRACRTRLARRSGGRRCGCGSGAWRRRRSPRSGRR